MVSTLAHGRCPSPSSVFWPIVSAQAHGQCSGAWAVFRVIDSVPTHGRVFDPWALCRPLAVFQPMGGAQGHCQCSTHGQRSGSWAVLRLTGGAHVHGQYPDRTTEDRRPAPRATRPNKAVEATGHKIRCWPGWCPWGVARASPLAFGFNEPYARLLPCLCLAYSCQLRIVVSNMFGVH